MKNKDTPKPVLGLRIRPALRVRVQSVARKLERSESWVVKRCVEKVLPELEKQQELSFDCADDHHVSLLAA